MKTTLRKHFLALRRSLSEERRREAAEQLLKKLDTYSSQFKRIASISSMNGEIDLSAFNQLLARQNRLLLPRRVDNALKYYPISNLQQLEKTQGSLLEPNPALYTHTAIGPGDLILVPGLAFDADGFRLGYGKGHFDKFLAKHPTIPTAGIGFLEQKSEEPLPRDVWDIPVKSLFLF